MAQLYKMTLYVCDLEGDMDIGELKARIEDMALNGCCVNCACHFADEKVGPVVEWDDDIDLNQCDCPTEKWEAYFQNT